MGHFAKVVDGIVTRVIVAEPEFFHTFFDPTPGSWIQTSYNTRGNIHYGPDGKPSGKPALRGNYAGVGFIYDSSNDVFIAPQPYPSWILNKTSWLWEAPEPYPTDGKIYEWNEDKVKWILKQ